MMNPTSPHLYRPRNSSLSYPQRRSTAAPILRMHSLVPHRRPRSWRSVLRSLLTLTNLLRLFWGALLLWGERRVFSAAVDACDWDAWERWPAHAAPHRMVLVADPQLVDPHTYPRRSLALAATTFYTDLYMARAYATLQASLLPHTTVFLGDLFDGGREWRVGAGNPAAPRRADKDVGPDPHGSKDWNKYAHPYWMKEYVRFDKIFPALPGRRTVKTLPGNHDLGIGNGIKESVLDRWRAYFGVTSSVLEAGNHSVVLLDTVSLSNDDTPRVYAPPRYFLDELAAGRTPVPERSQLWDRAIYTADSPPPPPQPASPPPDTAPAQKPRILLTHVPLWRDPDTPCGPQRERGNAIPIFYGYQYQNALTAQLSSEILQKTAARWVFSGDDHDACTVEHHYGSHGVVSETTVKSFSWAMGIRRPGFYMLSLWTGDGDKDSVQGHLCLLPDQIGVFFAYVCAALGSFAALFAQAAVRALRRKKDPGPVLPTHKSADGLGIASSSAAALGADAAGGGGGGSAYGNGAGNGSMLSPYSYGNGSGVGNGRRAAPSLGIDTAGAGTAAEEEERRDDGEGKYWKPRMAEVRRMRERWGWLYLGWREVRALLYSVGALYLWLIWRW